MFMAKDRKKHSEWALKLKALREALDLTQAEAASRADIPVRTWISWENSQSIPGPYAARILKQTYPDHL